MHPTPPHPTCPLNAPAPCCCRYELHGQGIDVVCIKPGAVKVRWGGDPHLVLGLRSLSMHPMPTTTCFPHLMSPPQPPPPSPPQTDIWARGHNASGQVLDKADPRVHQIYGKLIKQVGYCRPLGRCPQGRPVHLRLHACMVVVHAFCHSLTPVRCARPPPSPPQDRRRQPGC